MSDIPREPLPLNERIKQDPIHQWAAVVGIDVGSGNRILGIDPFLEFVEKQTGMPKTLETPFHELLVIRGQYPARISKEQAKEFGLMAKELTVKYELMPEAAWQLKGRLFEPVVAQWIEFMTENSPIN